MMFSRLDRCIMSVFIATLLASCGGSQPPIGAPGAMPQGRAIATHAGRSASWMLPEAKSGDLLYIANDAAGEVLAFSYPQGKLVGTLPGFEYPNGLCSDYQGDVFITNFQGEDILEYAHGGTNPIEILADAGYAPTGCGVDSTTGNLAVANYDHFSYRGSIAIFTHSSSSPAIYIDPTIYDYWFCGYDDDGNLFVDGTGAGSGFVFSELRSGSSTFKDLTIDEPIGTAGAIQWDGHYIALTSTHGFQRRLPENVYRLQISGSRVHVAGTTTLVPHGGFWAQTWIQGRTIIQPNAKGRSVNFWDYPKGGNPKKTLHRVHGNDLFGVTVSLAPRQLSRPAGAAIASDIDGR